MGVAANFMENHDQPRFASRVDSDEALRNWLALLYFEKGTTLLYSGQEYAPATVDLFNADDATAICGWTSSPISSSCAR